jgi:tyrosine-protein kinase Etk/Wzc
MVEKNGAPGEYHDDDDSISLLDPVLVMAEHIRLLVLLPLAAGLVALGIGFSITPTFIATTKLLPPQQPHGLASTLLNQLGGLAGPAGVAAGIKNPADMYVAMLESRTIADRLIERFGLKQLYNAEFDEHARKGLESRSKITAGRDGLIVIRVEDHDPRRAADLANAYVEELRALTQSLAVTEASQRRVFFEQQVKQARHDLTNAELALRGAGINEATLNTIPQSALEFVAGLKAKVTSQEIKLAAMRGFMTESNPEFRQTQTELYALRAQLAKLEANGGTKVSGRGAEYIARLRDFKYHETLFELMAKQYELARLDEARESALIQVVDSAVPPDFKSKPKRAQIAVLTSVIVFIVTLLALFVREGIHNAATDPRMAAKLRRLRQFLHFRRS